MCVCVVLGVVVVCVCVVLGLRGVCFFFWDVWCVLFLGGVVCVFLGWRGGGGGGVCVVQKGPWCVCVFVLRERGVCVDLRMRCVCLFLGGVV